MLLPVLRWVVVISGVLKILIAANSTENFCKTQLEVLQQIFNCDSFMISRLKEEIYSTKRLLKYLNYKKDNVDDQLERKCNNFIGVIQELSVDCSEKIVHRSCKKAMTRGSGVYQLKDEKNKIFFAYCIEDPDGGDPWMVIQRRESAAVSFTKSWDEYVNGFGDIIRSFWIGLDKLHQLTTAKPCELWIELIDWQKNRTFAKYDRFAIAYSKASYKLYELGKHSGTALNALDAHKNGEFGVILDEVKTDEKCSRRDKSGWWWSPKCGHCNLNGMYYGINAYKTKEYGVGIVWKDKNGNMQSLKYAHMAIRENHPEE